MIILVILFYITIVFFDQISLLKQGLKKDFYVSSALCFISFIIAVLITFNINLPSPAKPLEHLIKFILKL
ncbi:hypothetical protein C1I91_06900 [Clostridium manihotivorum]|uniref:Uncharacterized protein n=1 Tax=Clostridium manihotivorum TaxID=2320868 RepID=A0A3R5UE82_9CLOT|nr:hypothetical protein C1I91_06900 [Clostridium manihotivorum]